MNDETPPPVDAATPEPGLPAPPVPAVPPVPPVPPQTGDRAPWMPSAPDPSLSAGGLVPPPAIGSAPKSRKGIVAIGTAVVAFVGFIAIKVIIGFLVVGAATGAIGALFGGPWDRLPSDTRNQFESRLEAAVGPTFDSLSEADQGTKVTALLTGGLPRLDDATLISRLKLEAAAVNATDEATCAAFFRAALKSEPVEELSGKLIGSLDTATFAQWAEINVEAIEAESKGAPAARVPSDDDSNTAYAAVFASLSPADLATIQSVSGGTDQPDAAVCSAEKGLYAAALKLDAKSLATFALIDVS
jgi:hypothetical protein